MNIWKAIDLRLRRRPPAHGLLFLCDAGDKVLLFQWYRSSTSPTNVVISMYVMLLIGGRFSLVGNMKKRVGVGNILQSLVGNVGHVVSAKFFANADITTSRRHGGCRYHFWRDTVGTMSACPLHASTTTTTTTPPTTTTTTAAGLYTLLNHTTNRQL